VSYHTVPMEISISDVRKGSCSWSPSMYRTIVMPAKTTTVEQLLSGWDKGEDPGSFYYLRKSTHFLIRTKALQRHSYLISSRGDAIEPLSPTAFVDPSLTDGDILMSKDSNIGECAMVFGEQWRQHAISGGIVRLRPKADGFYLFAFLKHPLFRQDLGSRVPRGATIAHANELWRECRIPLPDQPDADRVRRYVSVMMHAIIEKERSIQARQRAIIQAIDDELGIRSGPQAFKYEHPSSKEVATTLRFDTGVYCRGFQEFKHRIDTYKHGSTKLSAMGVRSRRGPNLAVSVIGKCLYSDTQKPGWYELIRPVNMSEYGTLQSGEWLGTPKKLPTVKKGDLILGCEGFEKGRSIVITEDRDRTTTNFHGTALSWPGASMEEVVWLRCYLSFLREAGVVDWVGVGGSGGHMSPEYFDLLPIPKFPTIVKADIARLYHTRVNAFSDAGLTLGTFVPSHNSRNMELGILQLDSEMRTLAKQLALVQAQIIDGKTVIVPYAD
jgi:hypothetical protein